MGSWLVLRVRESWDAGRGGHGLKNVAEQRVVLTVESVSLCSRCNKYLFCLATCPEAQAIYEEEEREIYDMIKAGMKHDAGKQGWYAMPLEVLEPLGDVYTAGEKKYATFNCLLPFEDSSRRFYNGMMRHNAASQLDPLAKDEETGCYHLAQVAFNALMRLHHARKEAAEKFDREIQNETRA